MRNIIIFLFALPSALFAQDQASKAQDSAVVMPGIKVLGSRFESYHFNPHRYPDGTVRMVLYPYPIKPGFIAILVAGAQRGDVITGITSAKGSVDMNFSSLDACSRAISKVDYGDLKLTIRRAVGRRSFREMELDAHRLQ